MRQGLPSSGSNQKQKGINHMKRNLTLLTIVGALIALAVPASSSAAMFPAGHKFEIAGGSTGPKLTTSLGSCTISKITATIPAAPKNEEAGTWSGAALTPGTCTSGTSITLASEWSFGIAAGTFIASLFPKGAETVVMRFSSLPGCKLAGAPNLGGIWSNGTTSPTLLKSGYHAHTGSVLTWANDGGSCALAGKTEGLAYEDQALPTPPYAPVVNTVTDLTSPTTPITVANNK
jgi:hypothetical protein